MNIVIFKVSIFNKQKVVAISEQYEAGEITSLTLTGLGACNLMSFHKKLVPVNKG